MIVVIVEDDENKSRQLRQLIESWYADADVKECRSYQSGLRHLLHETANLVLMDMSMPTFDLLPGQGGGRIRGFGGRDILAELSRRGKACRVLVVTQFESFGEGDDTKSLEELTEELQREYSESFCGVVHYDAAQSAWREQLEHMVREAIR
jgi:DNA-binding NarL/FixJ family response regulator